MGYSNSEVAHRFATGIGERCTGSHMFFEVNVIYSYGYHFPMAIKWNGYVLYNDDSYSVSTSKHQGYVLGACSHMDIVHCASLDHFDTWDKKPTKGFIGRNLKLWLDEVGELTKKMALARKPEKWMAEILRVVDRVERFCKVFGEDVPENLFKYNDEEYVEKAREFAKLELKEERERQKAREAEEIQKFHEFKKSWVNLPYQIVRYREDKNRFETSKGVEIPYEIGKRFYEKLRDGELKVWDKVLHYTVTSVGETVKIGCHTFKKSYLLDYGKKMFNE
jgi:hypothetical protein